MNEGPNLNTTDSAMPSHERGTDNEAEGKTTYQTLGDEVKFDAGRAMQLREDEKGRASSDELLAQIESERQKWDEVFKMEPGMPPEVTATEAPAETVAMETSAETVAAEKPAETPEETTGTAMEEAPVETTEEVAEKTRTEQEIDRVKSRLEQIQRQIDEANATKEQAEAVIAEAEEAIEKNIDGRNRLGAKADELRAEVAKTKRGLVNGAVNFLKLAKSLALGRHEEAKHTLNEMSETVDRHEQATEKLQETTDAMAGLRDERRTLEATIGEAANNRRASIAQITKLERQKLEAEAQLDRLQEENTLEQAEEKRRAEQLDFKKQMGITSLPEFRNRLKIYEKGLKQEFAESMAQLDDIERGAGRAGLMGNFIRGAFSEFGKDFDSFVDEQRNVVMDKYTREMNNLQTTRAEMNEVFPSWQERVSRLKANDLVKNALSTVKRRVLITAYNWSAV